MSFAEFLYYNMKKNRLWEIEKENKYANKQTNKQTILAQTSADVKDVTNITTFIKRLEVVNG